MDGTKATKSTFGQQVLSNRPTSPTSKFGSGSRTSKVHDTTFETALLGRTSAGPTCTVSSAFGKQAKSRCRTAPACRVPKASLQGSLPGGSTQLGPRAYNVPGDTIGVVLLESRRPTSAAYKLGTSPRWCELKGGLTGEPVQPLLVNTKLTRGFLGDAPAWTFHGPKQRRPLTAGSLQGPSCPLPPTSSASPGPAAYTTQLSSFGNQVPSDATSSPAVCIPRAPRDALLLQALPRGQQHVLMGRSSPGPCCPQVSSLGKQLVSRARSASGMKFGTSDRFSDLKPKAAAKPASPGSSMSGSSSFSQSAGRHRGSKAGPAWPDGPGPGDYVV